MSEDRPLKEGTSDFDPRFETSVVQLLARFLNLPPSALNGEIEKSIQNVAQYFGFEEGLFIECHHDSVEPKSSHLWNIARAASAESASAFPALPWICSQLMTGKVVIVSGVADLPSEAVLDRAFFERDGRKALLAVPLKVGDDVVGGFAFATSESGMLWSEYALQRLQSLSGIFAAVFERTWQRLEMEAQLRFESLLTEISSFFVNVPADRIHASIEEAQRLFCENLCLDRSSLFQCFPASPEKMLLTHLYQRPGLPFPVLKRSDPVLKIENYWREPGPGSAGEYTRIDCRELYPWFFEQLQARKTVVVPDLHALGEEALIDKKNLSQYGTKSTVVVPLFAGDKWLGILTFGAVNRPRNWTDHEVKRFEFLANLFTNALVRERSDSALRDSEARFRNIADSAPVLIWMSSPDQHTYFFNKRWLEFTGRTLDQELGNRWTESVHPDDLTVYLEKRIDAFNRRVPFQIIYRLRRHDGDYRWIQANGVPQNDVDGSFAGFIGSGTDVTENKLAEEALQRSLAEIQRLKDRLQVESEYLRAEIKVTQSFGEIIGQSESIRQVLHLVEQVAPAECPVLIAGETGTGKELIARAIHRLSPRSERAMVKVNCAALPSTLVESELFGRERGAFTGASTSQVGRFEVANHSTIFLDEVGDLPLEVQAKLLRVLQEGEFERLGSPRTCKVNTRLIAATNRDLAEEVRQGRFREDLFYRLSVFPIKVPPLRERSEDIPDLVSAFVAEFSSRMGRRITNIPRRTMEMLQRYSWPGNIRELRNVLEHGVILSAGEALRIPHLTPAASGRPSSLAEMERDHILKTLEQTGGRIKGRHGAAELLGLHPATLYSRMQKLGIPNRRQKDDRQS